MRKQTKGADFLKRIAYIGNNDINDDNGTIYYSKYDGSYITRVGMEDSVDFLISRGITDEIQSTNGGKVACIGYNPIEKKWYGWSHRAIFGFSVGSECRPGQCHYNPDNKEAFRQDCLRFWGDPDYSIGDERAEFGIGEGYDGKTTEGVYVRYTFNDIVPNKNLRGTKYEHFSPFPKEWGKGEWTATTMEEAKQMAIDFASGVG